MEPGSSRPDGWQGLAPAVVGTEVIVADAAWRRLLPRAEMLARRAVAATSD